MKYVPLSEMQLNGSARHWSHAQFAVASRAVDCTARSPEAILDAWTQDLQSACNRLKSESGRSAPTEPVEIDDGAFPDLLFA